MNRSHHQTGYVALLAVLVMGAVATATAMALLLTGTDSLRQVQATQHSIQSRTIAHACAEEALQVIHDNTTFTGNGNLSFSVGSCTYTVTNTGGNNRSIAVTSTMFEITRKLQISVTIGASISIVSWQEAS